MWTRSRVGPILMGRATGRSVRLTASNVGWPGFWRNWGVWGDRSHRSSCGGLAGDGFAQAFQESSQLCLAVFETSHTVVEALHVLAQPSLHPVHSPMRGPVQIKHETDDDGWRNPLGKFRRHQLFLKAS